MSKSRESAEDIVAGARTVRQLDVHFSELKTAALDLLTSNSARTRGYFTPTEEEHCQHLLVSYWHSRNALLDLVLSLRQRAQPTDEAFVVGFSAALLLVDAARFLREACEGEPILRRKLNEAVPSFGVPAGVYEAVQRSLTSPVNAWRLYQAVEYFDQHASRLRQAADEAQLSELWTIIERFQSRLRVPASRYIPARIRVRTRQGIDTVTRDGLARVLYRMQRMMSTLASAISVCPDHLPDLPASVATEIQACIRPGDVLITRKEFALTNYFLPGFWPHAALYLGDTAWLEQHGFVDHPQLRSNWTRVQTLDPQQQGRVLEALKDGVWIRSLSSSFSSDSIVVLRPQLAEQHIQAALVRALAHEGKPYDFDFDFTRSDRMVCTEVIYRSYEGIDGTHFPLTRRAGRLTLGACDLLSMARERRHFAIVAAYLPDGLRQVTRDEQATASIAQWLARH